MKIAVRVLPIAVTCALSMPALPASGSGGEPGRVLQGTNECTGEAIVFNREKRPRDDEYDPDLYVVSLDGGSPVQITFKRRWNESDADVSPDYRSIAFSNGGSIWRIRPDGSRLRWLTGVDEDMDPEAIWDHSPDWSNGGSVVFVHDYFGASFYVDDPTDEAEPELIFNPSGDGGPWSTDLDPTWSPDGSSIMFADTRGPSTGDFVDNDLYTITTSGENLQALTSDPAEDLDASWHPDGSAIVFASNRDGDFEIFRLDTSGPESPLNPAVQLTFNTFDDLRPKFSPDGSRIAFARSVAQNLDIFTMTDEGNDERRLTFRRAEDSSPEWIC